MLGANRDGDRSFTDDERAIEGLPIRLVIALVVGVAALGIMMQVLGTFSFGAAQEVDIDFNDQAIVEPGVTGDTTVTVIDDDTGEPIPEADVIVRGGTLALEDPYYGTTNDQGNLTFSVGDGEDVEPDWRSTQESGEITFTINPPEDSNYEDNQDNGQMTVIRP